jgi:2-polyprenyl-3-methyl-5-hydroxy-6-metoxy-1,4-benzoquinol methylase
VEPASSRYTFKADAYSSHSIVLDWLGAGEGRRLLDVGCADGVLSRRFTERGWTVTTIEGDPERAAVAAPHCERLILADLDRKIPALDERFDVIVYADVLEHLVDPLRVLRELNASLMPDGRVVISIPNVAHLWTRLSLLCGRFDYADRGILDRDHLRFFTDRSLRALVTAAGLAVVRRTVTPVPLFEVVPRSLHGRWLGRVHALSAVMARRLPRLLGYQFVVLARSAPRDVR